MPDDNRSTNSASHRSRIVLSSKTKKQIRELVGKCEYCDSRYSPDDLDVFLLGMLSRSMQRPEENPAKIIIVLCKDHFMQASAGKLLKTTLRSKIDKRPDKIKKSLRSLLLTHDRTYEGSNVRETHDPNRFTVGAFLPNKNKRPDKD